MAPAFSRPAGTAVGTGASFTTPQLFSNAQYRVRVTDPSNNASVDSSYATVTVQLPVPAGITATFIGTSIIRVAWSVVTGADHYEVQCTSRFGVQTITAASVGVDHNALADGTPLPANTTFVYQVRAMPASGGGQSALGGKGLATTMTFTDLTLDPFIRVAHMEEIRTALNAVRAASNQAALSCDVAALGGKVEFRQDDEMVVTVPQDRLGQLRGDARVKYLQPIEGTSDAEAVLIGTPVEPSAGGGRLAKSTTGAHLQPRTLGSIAMDLGTYAYDGSGNITAIGTDTYVYDGAQRLKQSMTGGTSESYTYDAFGNIASIGSRNISVDATTNRLNGTGYVYDAAGNMTSGDSYAFTFDAFNMAVTKQYNSDATTAESYLYDANDERIAVKLNGWWYWSVRDTDGKVLRQYRSSVATPAAEAVWMEDFVWRDGLLLGSERPAAMGGRRHDHLDHLGSPRLVTSDSGEIVSHHMYYPFGAEQTPVTQETANGFDREDPLKFTSHERDFPGGAGREAATSYLDYMHARYYSAGIARFFAADSVLGSRRWPQSWNQYAYALNNPARNTDPTGLESITVICGCPAPVPELPEDPGQPLPFFWDRWMDHKIFQYTYNAIAYGLGRVKPYAVGAAEVGMLFLPGLQGGRSCRVDG